MPYLTSRLLAPDSRVFADPKVGPDETTFQVDNTSDAYYSSPYYKAHQADLLPIPTGPPAVPLDLAAVVPPNFLAPYMAAKTMTFHCVGDTGISMAVRMANEAGVADAMVADLARQGAASPAFLFHLGDVIYNFGEAEYYYDQFYEPFRGYDRPIFAIPGNHDAEVQYGADVKTPLAPTLMAFLRNFCAAAPGRSPDSGAVLRTTMTQPGVYFTLDAPFVSIVGLYTNVLEGPGVISSQGGQFSPPLDDAQLNWLKAELNRLKGPRANRERAIVLACHHPPVSADAVHGGSVGQAADIDSACEEAGLWPDAIVSGHAHLYQRFTRTIAGGRQIPYIVAGSGGHNVSLPRGEVVGKAPITWGEYTLVKEPLLEYGYLTVTVDMSHAGSERMAIRFQSPVDPSAGDEVMVNLASHALSGA
ncbi:MAG TPA: metallophosphoesterase [Candidatus Dormibacteraeota bacterium]|nr:metallophosphoesterase [Candidatus Dormibacteraeota bacterium]